MPMKLFYQLNSDKQGLIVSAAIAEFAARGYANASTNAIVRNAGISKGSLFNYFVNKEELYFYLLDGVTAELVGVVERGIPKLSTDLFQRVIGYSALEFSWYIQNPEKAKLVISAFGKGDAEIDHKTAERYGAEEVNIFYRLLEDVDLRNFRWDKERTVDVLKWFLKGFNEDFLERVQIDGCSMEFVYGEYVRSLTEYMEMLKIGLLT